MIRESREPEQGYLDKIESLCKLLDALRPGTGKAIALLLRQAYEAGKTESSGVEEVSPAPTPEFAMCEGCKDEFNTEIAKEHNSPDVTRFCSLRCSGRDAESGIRELKAALSFALEFIQEPEWFPNKGDRQFWRERKQCASSLLVSSSTILIGDPND